MTGFVSHTLGIHPHAPVFFAGSRFHRRACSLYFRCHCRAKSSKTRTACSLLLFFLSFLSFFFVFVLVCFCTVWHKQTFVFFLFANVTTSAFRKQEKETIPTSLEFPDMPFHLLRAWISGAIAWFASMITSFDVSMPAAEGEPHGAATTHSPAGMSKPEPEPEPISDPDADALSLLADAAPAATTSCSEQFTAGSGRRNLLVELNTTVQQLHLHHHGRSLPSLGTIPAEDDEDDHVVRMDSMASKAATAAVPAPSSLADLVCITRRVSDSLFGVLYEGYTRGADHMPVAVKASVRQFADRQRSCSGNAVLESLSQEVAVLQQLQHVGGFQQLVLTASHERIHWLVTRWITGGVDGFTFCVSLPRAHVRPRAWQQYEPSARLLELYPWAQNRLHRDAALFWAQLVDRVTYLHAHGIVHCDISLENLMVDQSVTCLPDQQVVLIDFGCSVTFDPSAVPWWTVPCPPILRGKNNYIDPLSYRLEPHDLRQNDWFASGVVLFMLLTGHPPFVQARASDVYFRYLQTHGVADYIRARNYECPAQAVYLLDGMLAQDQAVRVWQPRDIKSHPWTQACRALQIDLVAQVTQQQQQPPLVSTVPNVNK